MVNSFRILEFDEVETPEDRVHYLEQECISYGLRTSLCTFLGGVVGVPLLLQSLHRIILVPIEYKMVCGVVLAISLSHSLGVQAKKKCLEDIKKQLDEKLGSS